MVCIMLSGKYVPPCPATPDVSMILPMIPWAIVNIAIIRSSPHVTTALARTNLINSFRACSGRFSSENELNCRMIPIKKKSTKSAYPIAFSASLIFTITPQIEPPLKSCGDSVSSRQISDNFSFHVPMALLRFSTIQLLDSNHSSLLICSIFKRKTAWHHTKRLFDDLVVFKTFFNVSTCIKHMKHDHTFRFFTRQIKHHVISYR